MEEEEITYYVIVKNGRKYYAPRILSSGETTSQWIFSVPVANAVGTLDAQSNGIALIRFGNYGVEPECWVVANDYLDGDRIYAFFRYCFSSNYADDTIAYSQSRVVVIADLKNNNAFYVSGSLSREDCLTGIRFWDSQKILFVIAKSIYDGVIGWKDYIYVAKLKSQKFIDTGWSMYLGETGCISPHFPLYNTWYVHNRKLFAYDQGWHKIICTDGKVSVPHLFSEVFNAHANLFGSVKDIAIHPNLP